MTYLVETTDTFGGDANYCWVRRYLIDAPTVDYRSPAYRRDLVRRAKAATEWTGLQCDTCSTGDGYEIRPRGICQVTFVTLVDDEIMLDHFTGKDLRSAAKGVA